MALDHKGFDPSTLVYWRKRLAKSDRPQRINEAVRAVVAQTGIVRGRSKRAVDSTILADAVATQDTITQLVSSIRRVGRVVPGGAEAITAVCTTHDYTIAGKPSIDWDEPGAKDALVSALVNDANALLEVFAGIDDEHWDESARAALALLALVDHARQEWANDPELRQQYRTIRPNVERTISQIANRGGRRLKLRYRGTTKNHAWLTQRTAALNLRNLISRGLTHTAGAWTLTPRTA